MESLPGILKVPTEIRRAIFAHLIPMSRTFTIKRSDRAPNIGQIRRLSFVSLQRPKLIDYLLINHSLSSEVLDMLYGSNTFTFNDPWLIETFIVRIGQLNLKRIAHLEVQSGSLRKSNNTTTANTLFSVISAYFSNLLTLRVIGVGRGKKLKSIFYPTRWLPAHLERLEFLVSLHGALKGAQVYCDKDENNSRLLCNGAEYKMEWDELEVDIQNARKEVKDGDKEAKKRKASMDEADSSIAVSKAGQEQRTSEGGAQRNDPRYFHLTVGNPEGCAGNVSVS